MSSRFAGVTPAADQVPRPARSLVQCRFLLPSAVPKRAKARSSGLFGSGAGAGSED